MRVTIDFETASDADLMSAGASAYWEHFSATEILCLCAISDTGVDDNERE